MPGEFHQLDNNSSAGAPEVHIACKVLDGHFAAFACSLLALLSKHTKDINLHIFTQWITISFICTYLMIQEMNDVLEQMYENWRL